MAKGAEGFSQAGLSSDQSVGESIRPEPRLNAAECKLEKRESRSVAGSEETETETKATKNGPEGVNPAKTSEGRSDARCLEDAVARCAALGCLPEGLEAKDFQTVHEPAGKILVPLEAEDPGAAVDAPAATQGGVATDSPTDAIPDAPEAPEEWQRLRATRPVKNPTRQEYDDHMKTHFPYEVWCEHCKS